jgi:hypothetical protein
MWKFMGWTSIAVLVAVGIGDLGRADSAVSPTAMGALLLGLGLLVGLRLGSDSASRFVKDLLRLNKFLADQNNQLSELNHWHVKRKKSQLSDTTEESVNDG